MQRRDFRRQTVLRVRRCGVLGFGDGWTCGQEQMDVVILSMFSLYVRKSRRSREECCVLREEEEGEVRSLIQPCMPRTLHSLNSFAASATSPDNSQRRRLSRGTCFTDSVRTWPCTAHLQVSCAAGQTSQHSSSHHKTTLSSQLTAGSVLSHCWVPDLIRLDFDFIALCLSALLARATLILDLSSLPRCLLTQWFVCNSVD